MSSRPIEKIVGVYFLHSIRETATGFKLNPDGTFQFFFTYGALDRYGSGTWTVEDDRVLFQSRPWSGKDFALVQSGTSGAGITVKVTDANPIYQKHVLSSLQNGVQGTWLSPDTKGEMHFGDSKAATITMAFEFCPERYSFFPVENPEHNYFEFRLEPWLMETFLKDFHLKVKRRVLIGGHPLMRGDEFIYEKE